MDNFKFLKTVIVVLLLVNIGTLAYLWFGNRGNGSHQPQGRGNAMYFLTNELKLSVEQQKRLDELRHNHNEIMDHIQKEDRELHDNYFNLLSDPVFDSSKVNSIAVDMSSNRKKIELQTFYHFKEVRALLNEDQQKRFDELIGDALRQMGRPPRR